MFKNITFTFICSFISIVKNDGKFCYFQSTHIAKPDTDLVVILLLLLLFTALYSIQFYNKVQSKMLTMVNSNIAIKIIKINVKYIKD